MRLNCSSTKKVYLVIILLTILFLNYSISFTTIAQQGKYCGSRKSDKYHYPSCYWAGKIYPENKIWFSDACNAKSMGYVPCKVCKPPLCGQEIIKPTTTTPTPSPTPPPTPIPAPIPTTTAPSTPSPTPTPLPTSTTTTSSSTVTSTTTQTTTTMTTTQELIQTETSEEILKTTEVAARAQTSNSYYAIGGGLLGLVALALLLMHKRRKVAYVKPSRFEIFKDVSGQYRFRLRAPNNEIIISSEAYTTKAACMNGVESVKKSAPIAETIEIKLIT